LVTSTDTTSASTAWSAGTAQVETATAAGTITASGNATITVTAAGMTGSPKAISVAVTNTDTAATWAGKVRTALAADADVSALFTVGGTTTAISLTRKVNSRGVLPGNDATLNIATANGTCTGITAAATSANTTAGVASDGAYIYDGDAKDFEGVTIPTIATLKAIEIICDHGEVDLTSTDETSTIKAGERRTISNDNGMPSFLATLTFTAVSESDISITVFGATA
jgi:phage tail sheath gpL-like